MKSFELKSDKGAIGLLLAEVAIVVIICSLLALAGQGLVALVLGVFVLLVVAASCRMRYCVDHLGVRVTTAGITIGKVNWVDVVSIDQGRGWPISHTLKPLRGINLNTKRGRFLAIPLDEQAFLASVLEFAPQLRSVCEVTSDAT